MNSSNCHVSSFWSNVSLVLFGLSSLLTTWDARGGGGGDKPFYSQANLKMAKSTITDSSESRFLSLMAGGHE